MRRALAADRLDFQLILRQNLTLVTANQCQAMESTVKRLVGKHILISAAANGIGRACLVAALEQGAQVYATDLVPIDTSGLPTDRLRTAVLDGTDPGAIDEFVTQLPDLHSVIHCIGYVHQGTVLTCDHAHWRRSFATNVDSFYYLLQAVLPRMLASGAGSVVCIASVASSLKGFPQRAAYGASKAALIGLVKAVAADYVEQGIRCNAVCPGTVMSASLLERIDALARHVGGHEKAMALFVGRQPMKRLGKPEEIAQMCVYLASDESRFVTGQAFAIDGGVTI